MRKYKFQVMMVLVCFLGIVLQGNFTTLRAETCALDNLEPGAWEITDGILDDDELVVDSDGTVDWGMLGVSVDGTCRIDGGSSFSHTIYFDTYNYDLTCQNGEVTITSSDSDGVNPKTTWNLNLTGSRTSSIKMKGTMKVTASLISYNSNTGSTMSCSGSNTVSWTSELGARGPTLTITSHNNGQTVTESPITLAGRATDYDVGGSGIQQVTVNGSRANNDTATGSNWASWSKTVSLLSGANTIRVVAYDDSPYHAATTKTITLYLGGGSTDNQGPDLEITSHANNETTATTAITLQGTASDAGLGDNGIQQVTVNGDEAVLDSVTGSGVADWYKTISLTEGSNTITVVAYDNSAAHNATTKTITIISAPDNADKEGPSLDITSHSDNQTIYTWSTVLKGKASDWSFGSNGIQQVLVNGNRASYDSSTGSTTANWVASVDLAEGDNIITVTAYDDSSNHNATTQSITLNYQVNPRLKWRYDAAGTVTCPAMDADGIIYFRADNYLIALNSDGTLKWKFEATSNFSTRPAIGSDGTIYIALNDESTLFAINPDGSEKWRFVAWYFMYSSPAIGLDQTIYLGSSDYLFAINPDGMRKWIFRTDGTVRSSPAIGSDGVIYVGSDDDNLYAVNPDGTEKWRFTTGSYIENSPAISSDGVVYVGSNDGNLYAIYPDGTEKWRFDTGSAIWGSPVIGADEVVYVGSLNDYIFALNPDGTEKWRFNIGCTPETPAIDSDGVIYTPYNTESYVAINPDGTVKWEFKTPSVILSASAIGPSGIVYFGTTEELCAVQGDSQGLADSAWPMFRHDLLHTGRAPGTEANKKNLMPFLELLLF